MRHRVHTNSNFYIGKTVRQDTWKLANGSGTVLSLGILCSLLSVTGLFVAYSDRFVEQARLDALADTAALAGADALRGLVAGSPCDVARKLVPQLESCQVVDFDLRVIVRNGDFISRSRAGGP